MATIGPPEPTAQGTDSVHKPASLLGLPPGLRLEIYDHLFVLLAIPTDDDFITHLTTSHQIPHSADPFPGLLRTSSFLRHEASQQYREYLTLLLNSLRTYIDELEWDLVRASRLSNL